ncbi:hypothetical protein [Ralstonia sp. GP101]|uniref:hypothetical protein n=1 Tax=unclassified Ralstonia TaxID=209769 RepID=UPI0038913B69
MLLDALQLKLRSGAGPFRSFGNIAVEPRAYQLVPLLMALKLPTVRLLIADDVGIGKTIEGALIARELLDRGEIQRLSVLCPPTCANNGSASWPSASTSRPLSYALIRPTAWNVTSRPALQSSMLTRTR